MNELTLSVLGERLKDVRVFLGLTQAEVAEKLDESQSSVARLEKGAELGSVKLLKFLDFYSKTVSISVVFNDFYDRTQLRMKNEYKENFEAEQLRLVIEKHKNTMKEQLEDAFNNMCVDIGLAKKEE
ncbi:MAG: helix-turn-helix transcriptional regulator [Rikenellaceae bacterium]